MNLYLLLVLLHILATAGLFASLGIEMAALRNLQRANTPDEARHWLPLVQRPGGMLEQLSMAGLLVTGLGMAALNASLTPWMAAALVAILAMIVLAEVLYNPALAAVATDLVGDEPLSDWRDHSRDPKLHLGLWARVGLLAGVLGLMALKPATVGSIATVAAGLVLGGMASVITRPNGAGVSRQEARTDGEVTP